MIAEFNELYENFLFLTLFNKAKFSEEFNLLESRSLIFSLNKYDDSEEVRLELSGLVKRLITKYKADVPNFSELALIVTLHKGERAIKAKVTTTDNKFYESEPFLVDFNIISTVHYLRMTPSKLPLHEVIHSLGDVNKTPPTSPQELVDALLELGICFSDKSLLLDSVLQCIGGDDHVVPNKVLTKIKETLTKGVPIFLATYPDAVITVHNRLKNSGRLVHTLIEFTNKNGSPPVYGFTGYHAVNKLVALCLTIVYLNRNIDYVKSDNIKLEGVSNV